MRPIEQRNLLLAALLFAILFKVNVNLSFLELTSPLLSDGTVPQPLLIGGDTDESHSEPPYWLLYDKEYQCKGCIENASYKAPDELRKDSVPYHQRTMSMSI